jgi:hypothetical protein
MAGITVLDTKCPLFYAFCWSLAAHYALLDFLQNLVFQVSFSIIKAET